MINRELLKEITEYCDVNELPLEDTINNALKKGFTIEKYGATPLSAKKDTKPVEVIKTVEKVVEKIVEVSNDEELTKVLDKLEDTIDRQVEQISELQGKIDELEKLIEDNTKKDIYGE